MCVYMYVYMYIYVYMYPTVSETPSCKTQYLFAAKCQQVRVFCDDGLGQTRFGEVGQLSVRFIGSHNTVHPS